jgi:alpha-glucosidase
MVNPKLPDLWYHRAVLYRIEPARWADGNGDGLGDLAGLRSHLDYLCDSESESLGVGAVWLGGLYAAGGEPGGDAITDHMAIDPRLGSLSEFDQFVAEAHQRGLRVLLDFVAGHTGSEHPWFQAARRSRAQAKRDWYVWADPATGGGAPNNWLNRAGASAWDYDERTDQYYLCTGGSGRPDLNWRQPEVRQAMLGVLQFWLERGVDGFRAAETAGLLKDQSLRDDPPNPEYRRGLSDPAQAHLRVHSSLRVGLPQVLGPVCDLLAAESHQLLLSEAYLNLPSLRELYGSCSSHPGLHAPYNFNLLALPWSPGAYQSFIDEYEAAVGAEEWPNYVLGDPDQPRLAARLGHERARLLALMQLTLRGLPVVYYGDELGLEADARAAMPWAELAAHERDPESLVQLYRHLIHLRTTCEPLIEGDYRALESDNSEVMMYARESPGGKCYVLLNFSDHPQTVRLRQIGQWIAGTHQLHGSGERHTTGSIQLAPYEGRLYEMRRGGQ